MIDIDELDRIAANTAHHEPDEDMPRLIATLREAWSDVEECRALVNRQGELLTAAANALRGDPPPLTTWSHHDVAELACLLRERAEKAEAQVRRVLALADEYARGRGAPTSRRIRFAIDHPTTEGTAS